MSRKISNFQGDYRPTEPVKDDAVADEDRIPVQRSSTPTPSRFTTPERDYSEFCAEYKQRFLYVCPDPFRYARASLLCPSCETVRATFELASSAHSSCELLIRK